MVAVPGTSDKRSLQRAFGNRATATPKKETDARSTSILASANFYVAMDGMEGCELDDVVVDVSDAPDELEALNDDLLRRILAFAGPTAALRQSSRLLHWLGNDDTLWQEWCERVDAERYEKMTWRDTYMLATQCGPHLRGERRLEYKMPKPYASFVTDEAVRRWYMTPQHEPLYTSCVCTHCKVTFNITVEACQPTTPGDQHAFNGVRMSNVHFSTKNGSRKWTETWYSNADSLYSLRGGEGLELQGTPGPAAKVVFEAPVGVFAGLM